MIAAVDVNEKQIDGSTNDVLAMGSIGAKFKAFDWEVIHVKQGNNLDAIDEALTQAKSKLGNGKPICMLLQTEMGNGVDFMMGTHKWHGVAPNDEQLLSALSQNEETLGDY